MQLGDFLTAVQQRLPVKIVVIKNNALVLIKWEQMPAKVKKQQVTKMMQALREGTPNRNRIALQMVNDMLDESTFDASPGHIIPGKVGQAAAGVAGKLRDLTSDEHPE